MKANRDVKAGEIVIVPVDVVLTQDGTGPLAVRQLEKMNLVRAANPEKTILFIDHASPSPRKELSNDHILLRGFAEKTGARLSDVGEGVCHQIVAEEYAKPGDVVIGADSTPVPPAPWGPLPRVWVPPTWLWASPWARPGSGTGDHPGGGQRDAARICVLKDVIISLIGEITADGTTRP